MDVILLSVLIGLVAVLLIILCIFLVIQLRKPPLNITDLSTALQNLNQSVQHTQLQSTSMGEKLTQLEALPQTLTALHVELRGVSERVGVVEHYQTNTNQGIVYLAQSLTETSATMTTVRDDLTRAKDHLTQIQIQTKISQETEQRTAQAIRRLETIIAGTQTKGVAGENILEAIFAKFPAEWQVRNFRVAGKPVEFGLKLPNNLILPIDSKWPATAALEQFSATNDIDEQRRLKSDIENLVLRKAREVNKYIDPNITVTFGVAVVPDAVYDLCTGIQMDIFQLNVVLVSYTMFVPYLLLVFQTILKAGQSVDLHKLDAYLQTAQSTIKILQEEVDGRFSRSITMLNNSRDELRTQLSKVSSGLIGIQVHTSLPSATTEFRDVGPDISAI